jgi:DHA1 family tetracycline resistance protein-like MFS transporter
MMTHRVSEREQGELQGALQSMRSITFIIGPILFLRVFSWFINPKHSLHLPGAPYFLAAVLLLIAMLLSTRLHGPDSKTLPAATQPDEPETIPGVVPPGVAEPPTM